MAWGGAGWEEAPQRRLPGTGKGLKWEGAGAFESLKRGPRAWTGPGTWKGRGVGAFPENKEASHWGGVFRCAFWKDPSGVGRPASWGVQGVEVGVWRGLEASGGERGADSQ